MQNARLPKALGRKRVRDLSPKDLVAVHDHIALFKLIRATNVELWAVLGPVLATKRRMGFCAMTLSCTNKTDGKHRGCLECRNRAQEAKANRDTRGPRRLTAYQQWRRQQ